MEETDRLINSVHSYTPLWDMKDRRYHSRDIQRKLWLNVADEVGGDVAELKNKWKGLRDSLRRELRKQNKSGSEASQEFISTWPFFENLLFLADAMEPRKLKGNISSPSKNENSSKLHNDTDTDVHQDILENASEIEPLEIEPPQITPAKGKRKIQDNNSDVLRKETTAFEIRKTNKKKICNGESSEAKFLEIERAKLKLLSEISSIKGYSDYQFLVSLLPFLKKVPEHRKLNVRSKIQQVLIDEEQWHSSSNPNTFIVTSLSSFSSDNQETDSIWKSATQINSQTPISVMTTDKH